MAVGYVQSGLYTQKPSGLKNFGEGVLTNIKYTVPVLSGHTVGDYFSKQNETVENLTGTQDGKEAGFFKKTINGAWKKFVYALPIIGTYQLGKNKVQHENLKNQIEAAKNGTLSEEVINSACRRVLVWKQALGLLDPDVIDHFRSFS